MVLTMNEKPWKKCKLCPKETFTSPYQFGDHLRIFHSKKEGGSHVCLYGANAMCPQLPYEGVSDRDYESHIAKCHIFSNYNIRSAKCDNSRIENTKNESCENRLSCFPNPKNGIFNWPDQDQKLYQDKPNVIDDSKWNFYLSSQNLTSILNDPLKSRSYYDNLFSKDWGFHFVEPVSISPYPISKMSSQVMFDNYVYKISKRKSNHFIKNSTGTNNQSTNVTRADTVVPSLFFQSDFNLEESDTFMSLLHLFGSKENMESLEFFFDQKSMNDIQKLLSEYLDMVEQDLAQQICKRSKDFFQVMSSMDLVMEKLKISIKKVTTIRKNCNQLENNLVVPIQKNIQLTKLRSKYRDIFKKINWIATVHQTQPTIQLLLSKNDYAGALDLISTSQEVVTQELSGVISFRYLKSQLMEIEKVIEQMMNEEFVRYLTAEWNRPITQDSNDNIQEEKLLSIIYGMFKLQKFNFIDTFREEAFTAIKTNVKQTVIQILSSEDNIEVSRIDASLFDQLKCLNFEKWLSCLETVFSQLATLIKRVNLVYNVINNGFIKITNNSNMRNNFPQQNQDTISNNLEDVNFKIILQSDYYELSANLKEILCSICDFAHSRCASIIELRINDGTLERLDSSEFLRLIHLIDEFINECESLCGRKSPNLKLIIQIQSNKFVTKFHDERKRKLKQLLDLEQWKAINNINEDLQSLCSKLVNIEEHSNLIDIYKNFKDFKNINISKTSNVLIKGTNYILLNNEKFVVVNAVINLIYIILEYCESAHEIPFLSPDLLLRLIDILKMFNSRTSQLVLGAEALQISGLKTISAGTLIISLRSLIFVTRFIPRIKTHFESLLIDRQMNILKQLDDLYKLYDNHMQKIPEKVCSLVKDVVSSYLNKWVAKAPVPSTCFQTISQHLTRLHENIQDILPHKDLLSLFQRIHSIVIEVFREQLQKLKIVNNGGPQHGLVTQELTFYIKSLRNLSVGKEMDLSTDKLWS